MERFVNIGLSNSRKHSGVLYLFPLNAVTRKTERRLLDTQIKELNDCIIG